MGRRALDHQHYAEDLIDPSSDTSAIAVRSRTTLLTNTQVKALPTTPVELVPAPGAGKFLWFLDAEVYLDALAGGYTGANDGYLWIGHQPQVFSQENTSNGARIPRLSAGAKQQWSHLTPIQYELEFNERFEGDADPFEVQAPLAALTLQHNDSSGGFGGGHANNFMRVTVRYSVVDI